jgi:carboxypeptidase T
LPCAARPLSLQAVLKRGVIAGALAGVLLLVLGGGAAAYTYEGDLSPRPAATEVRAFDVYGVTTREQRSRLVSEGYDIGEAYWPDHVELYGTAQQARQLLLRGFGVMPKAPPPHGGFEIPDDFPPGYENYHNYAEMVANLQALAAAHPQFVHIFSLGQSYEGRDLIGVRISNDANDNLSEPGVFFVGQHHAREHMTVEVTLSLAHLFVESSKVHIRSLVYSRQIYIVPSLNPDGSEYDIATGTFRYWRKNRQPAPPPNQNIYGTDQNRNYTYRWGCCGGSSGNPGSETYRGPFALSTPEDARMSDFMLAHPNVTTGISYHTYGDLILYPYGYTYEDIPPDMQPIDHQTFVAMGSEMASTTGYTPQQSSDLYITDGDWNDWMYGAHHRYPITIEGSSHGYGFYPPDSFIPQDTVRNHAAAVFVASIADCPKRIVGGSCS